MKDSIAFSVGLTTTVLITVVLMSSLNFPFNWVFFVTLFGQALLVWMVYKVLTDNYSTDKTFDDFYEDAPVDHRTNG